MCPVGVLREKKVYEENFWEMSKTYGLVYSWHFMAPVGLAEVGDEISSLRVLHWAQERPSAA